MIASTTVELKYHCELSKAEADYIQLLCQNYLGAGAESNQERRIREGIFLALKNAPPYPQSVIEKGS